MNERLWVKALFYVVMIAVAGATYYIAQRAIDERRAALPVKQYLDCIQKLSAYDWSKFPGERPDVSEVCAELSSREKLGRR